ncbi:hypothetical protein RUM43_007541 [Polyplax serrata]|uniref:INTS8 TPR repeats domain-containing protein n=1 Tax=Polyplax serrata TaxID=468196 RepID=A0AAN8P600_POLSC
MDVDRLRPGTVPLAPDTILWFEFLLDSNLLEKHLNKPNPDPSPIDLILKLLAVDKKEEVIVLDDENGGSEGHSAPKITKKSVAIKILILRIMAFLNWDLDILESKFPLPMQVTLLHDLLYIAMGEVPAFSHFNFDFATANHQTIFAVSLYHRWVLKSYMCGSLVTKQPRVPFIPIPGLQDPNLVAQNQREEIRQTLVEQLNDSLEICNKMLNLDSLIVPTINSFIHIDESTTDINTKWDSGAELSAQELKCQVNYELGCFTFFRDDYVSAKQYFTDCCKLYEELQANVTLQSKVQFCNINRQRLEGYCKAFDISFKSEDSATPDLYDQFKLSILNQYSGIIQILQADNEALLIPLIQREMMEMDIQAATCSGAFTVAKDLLLKIQILNTLRRVCTNEINNTNMVQCLRNGGDKGIDFFLGALKPLILHSDVKRRENIRYFLLDLILRDLTTERTPSNFTASILEDPVVKNLFTENDISYINITRGNLPNEISQLLSSSKNDIPVNLIMKSPRLEVIKIQQQLIQSNDTVKIKDLLQKLYSKRPGKSWWKLNNKWDLPIPLTGVAMSLQKGYLQDLVYILLAKSRELSARKVDFKKSILLLENTAKEVKAAVSANSNIIYKMNRLLDWEILLIHINQYLDEYPHNNTHTTQLTSSCKSCLAALQTSDSVIPRLEVMENCALALLNLGKWEVLTSVDKRWTYLELAAAFAYACQDISKHKGNKKISRDAWDLVLPVFGPSPQNKRISGATVSPTGLNLTKNYLVNFFIRLREPTCLAVVISLLARLHNVLKDEPNLEINCQYIGVWPAVVSNSNSYSSRSVAEVLTQVTLQALKFMPKQSSFLKVLGDLNYVTGDWASALRYYLEAGAVTSDFFSHPVPKTILDNFIYKRMIKCCSQLQCYTQAAVLCQFLDEVDYTCAFKNLAETKNSHCADAMDAYYSCIWDLTILEYLINLHNKRGENHRKRQVIKLIGMLELNSNNNEEIQREAANIRKKQFLRAMTNQYKLSKGTVTFRK